MNSTTPYAARWRRLVAGVIALTVVLSPLLVDPVVLASVAVAGAVVSAIFAAGTSISEGDRTPISLSRLGRITAWGASALVAMMVVGMVSETLMVWLLVLAALSCPPLVESARRTTARLARPAETAPPQLPPEGTTRDLLLRLSSRDLCRVWRSTHHHLMAARPPAEVASYARLRAMVLDELESRHPDALAEWLASGAGAAEGPERFLPSDRRDSAS